MKTLLKLYLCFICYKTIITPVQAQLQVTVRGLTQQAAQEIQHQVNFYAQKLDIREANFLILFTDEIPQLLKGFTLYSPPSEYNTHNILIKIDKKLDPKSQYITLAHELVHAKQFYHKEIIHHCHNHYTWKGNSFEDISKIDYYCRAWEKEAYSLEKKLWLEYLAQQKVTNKEVF